MGVRSTRRYIVGVDEVGRGPLAGPVAVGVLMATPRVLRKFRKIKESKQLTPAQRAHWDQRIREQLGSELRYSIAFVSAAVIDRIGIAVAIRRAITNAFRRLALDPSECTVLLDGGLKAPSEFRDQTTIIRGDASETVIAMASVLAKVARDKRMDREDAKDPRYGYIRHKGYGSRAHRDAIARHGLSPLHRRTFCTRIPQPKA